MIDPVSREWPRFSATLLVLSTLLLAAACGDSAMEPTNRIVGGVDLDALFSAPTPAEIAAVESEWAGRDVSAHGYVLEREESASIGGGGATLQVVSHTVGGLRHFGAVLVPDGFSSGELPVLVYAHGGDRGTSAEELLVVAAAVHASGARFVYVAPTFRSESLVLATRTFISEGPPSPWDQDVDDALALLNTVIAHVPEADPSRIGVLGFSRGGGVALLMGIRDARIDAVVNFFGPTDFFDGYVQGVVEDALRMNPRDLPGLAFLDSAFIQPLREGTIHLDALRIELVRRSAVLFADRLPPLQTHHGTADAVVDVSQARSLDEALTRLGRTPPDYEVFIYPGAGHSPLEMPIALQRAFDFLGRVQ
ncbi:hypothetical protein BH23GEM11_BH23GEM11_06660 [soil metagenome]